jgi:hypothetical protein
MLAHPYALLDVALSRTVRCLCALVSFAAGVEWSYSIAMRLAGSPKPAVRLPNYFDAKLSLAKLVIEYVRALITSCH